MPTAMIAGATGLTGSFLKELIIQTHHYDKVKLLLRKPIDFYNDKVEQVIFDYEHPDPELIKADHFYCCLGTTIKKAGSREAFRKVDFEYPLKLAEYAHQNGATKYGLISAMGANSNSFFFYNRVKGDVEEQLQKFPFETIIIMRPSMILGLREEFRFAEEMGKLIIKPFQPLLPKNARSIHASQIASCMLDKMTGEIKGNHIILSGEMQNYPGKSTTVNQKNK